MWYKWDVKLAGKSEDAFPSQDYDGCLVFVLFVDKVSRLILSVFICFPFLIYIHIRKGV